ncbi:Secreted RxLR effector peptide protein [Phytophthora palmivora]|uniref:Secreted RxLR effector peptide protein n=1 Tax=Phytophthora palmivora TaxID=4796 RepID=A0A2P4XF67_9STRA|nr:Secreted RxLR effector peptide protein [Phytophthora palmivora]
MDVVFTKLKLNTAGEKLFENPKFLDWVKYVDDYNKNPDKMLEAAKQVKSTNSIATRLQTEQMSMWKTADITADELFQIYRLHDGVPAYPAINIWMRYADEFAPGTKTTLFETLQKHYSDNAFSQVVIAMMKVPSTEKLAVDLQKQQIRLWLDKLESPENVFKHLMLDKGADNLLANPQFKVWTGYALEFQKHAKGTQMSVIDTLMKNYTPKNMATIINTAKQNPNTKQMAQYVQGELLARDAKVSELQEAIFAKNRYSERYKFDASELTLYLARRKEETTWWKHDCKTERLLHRGSGTGYEEMISSWKLTELLGRDFQPKDERFTCWWNCPWTRWM